MRFVDFLIQVLLTHAKTLQRLAAFFGEEELLEMLESAGDGPSHTPTPTPNSTLLDSRWFESPPKVPNTSAYRELESAIMELKLPEVLEFHLWAYPFYRTLIESPVSLDARLLNSNELILLTTKHAEAWIKNLPIHPAVSTQAELVATQPWIRFRAEVLQRLGKRPVETIT